MRAAAWRVALLVGILLPTTAAAATDRAGQALARRRADLTRMLAPKGITFPPREVFLRAFKRERLLELWARQDRGPFQLVVSLPFCAASGELGPKQRSGDGQVPEGFYRLNRFNPRSSFHLSLGLDYPNAADRKRNGRPGVDLGGDIFIHGGCASIGCIAITDEGIEAVYLLALGARGRGQWQIPVHVFPARLDEAGLKWLRSRHAKQPSLIAFWESLLPAYLHFEKARSVPRVRLDARGGYQLDRRQEEPRDR